MRKADFGLFGSYWWPEAGFEQLKIATRIAIWVSVLFILGFLSLIHDQLFLCDDGEQCDLCACLPLLTLQNMTRKADSCGINWSSRMPIEMRLCNLFSTPSVFPATKKM